MHKPFILNMHLNELYKQEQDNLMARRLKKAKSTVNARCPKSFIFHNNNGHRPGAKDSICNLIFNY